MCPNGFSGPDCSDSKGMSHYVTGNIIQHPFGSTHTLFVGLGQLALSFGQGGVEFFFVLFTWLCGLFVGFSLLVYDRRNDTRRVEYQVKVAVVVVVMVTEGMIQEEWNTR